MDKSTKGHRKSIHTVNQKTKVQTQHHTVSGSTANAAGKGNSKPERRNTKRFSVKKGAFAFLRTKRKSYINIDKMSMGEIAIAVIKSNPSKVGPIKNLSKDGMSFQYVADGTKSAEAFSLDLLHADRRMHLKDLPFKAVADLEIQDDLSLNPIKSKQFSVQFKGLTSNQKRQLDHFIRHSTGDS